jgi:hypothetical protein
VVGGEIATIGEVQQRSGCGSSSAGVEHDHVTEACPGETCLAKRLKDGEAALVRIAFGFMQSGGTADPLLGSRLANKFERLREAAIAIKSLMTPCRLC